MCVTTLVYYTAYLAPLALFPCRGVSRRSDKRTVCNRSFDRASWTTSLKTSLSDGPGCWDPEAQFLLSSSRRSETCGTEETGINEVSLSGAWYSHIRHTGMCHSNCLLFHKKSLNMGPIFYKDIPKHGSVFVFFVCFSNFFWMGLYLEGNP